MLIATMILYQLCTLGCFTGYIVFDKHGMKKNYNVAFLESQIN